MKNKLTKQIFIACMLIFIVSFGLMTAVLSSYFSKRNMEELKERARYISAFAGEGSLEDLQRIPAGSTRITVIEPDGQVVYDSLLDASEMENHASREEFQQALRHGEGSSERYSASLLKKTVNYAVRMQDSRILRISMEQDTVWILMIRMLNSLGLAVLLTIFLSMILAARFSENLMRPINRLDVENPDDRDVYDEMKPFIRRIVSQNQQIHRQMDALQKEHKRQDDMRREFTANVSHELKTPLTSISGFAEIIRDGYVQEKDISHFADNIYQEAQRLMVLVNDILKLSKLEEGTDGVQGERTAEDLQEISAAVISRLEMSAAKRGIHMMLQGENAPVLGIHGMLEEIVYNVCDNAIKYNHSGGYVRITTGISGEKSFVRIEDNGIGIPEADRSRIFERFYRVNKSHSKEVGGTGLGLSIVKHGMAYHNAEITLDSEEGKGTTVGLYFPSLPAADCRLCLPSQ